MMPRPPVWMLIRIWLSERMIGFHGASLPLQLYVFLTCVLFPIFNLLLFCFKIDNSSSSSIPIQDQTTKIDKLNSYVSTIVMNIFVFVILVPKHALEDPKIDFICPVLWEEECYYLINHLKYNSDNGMGLSNLDSQLC